MTSKEVIELMKTSKSEEEWNNNAKIVKMLHVGKYPRFWHSSIVTSGIMDLVFEKFTKK